MVLFREPNLSPEERKWLTAMSNDAEPLQLVIIGRRGEYTILVEDLEQLYHEGGVSDRTIAGMVYRHVQEVQAEEGGEYEGGERNSDPS